MLTQRRRLVQLALSRKPAAKPGTKFQYSNIGYAIAGAMCERVTGKTWEDLMRERLFNPLGMTTAGFGPPGTAAKVDQPWGHLASGAKLKPIPPGRKADNPAVIGPAGTVHCSLADWAKFAAASLPHDANHKSLVSAATLRKLHTPLAGEDYAFGWLVTERGWAGGTAAHARGQQHDVVCRRLARPRERYGLPGGHQRRHPRRIPRLRRGHLGAHQNDRRVVEARRTARRLGRRPNSFGRRASRFSGRPPGDCDPKFS